MAAVDVVDQGKLHKLRLRMETDTVFYPGSGLRKLKIRGRDLMSVPRELFYLHELEVLDLSPTRETCLDNRLPDVPPSIGRLVNLKVLVLDTNELAEIPPEISLLKSLEKLSISNNHIQLFPDGFGALKNLKSLHAANNKLVAFPGSICELTNLRFLDLCDNLLTTIPDEIRKLKNMETLMLFINRLTSLPDSICELTQLKSLWIGQNNIKKLPRDFGNLDQLDWGQRHTISTALDGNPLEDPHLEVCKRGPEKIAAYFGSQDTRDRSRPEPAKSENEGDESTEESTSGSAQGAPPNKPTALRVTKRRGRRI